MSYDASQLTISYKSHRLENEMERLIRNLFTLASPTFDINASDISDSH